MIKADRCPDMSINDLRKYTLDSLAGDSSSDSRQNAGDNHSVEQEPKEPTHESDSGGKAR